MPSQWQLNGIKSILTMLRDVSFIFLVTKILIKIFAHSETSVSVGTTGNRNRTVPVLSVRYVRKVRFVRQHEAVSFRLCVG